MSGRIAVIALAFVAGCKGNTDTPSGKKTEPAAGGSSAAEPALVEAKPAEATPTQVTWFNYAGKDSGYTIELPGKPVESGGAGMKSVGSEFGSTSNDPRTSLCGVAAMTMPAAPPDPKTVLDGSTARHKEKATVIEDKPVSLGAHPGRSLIVDNGDTRKWIRVYVVDKTLYILKCTGPVVRALSDEPVALKALGSFALAK